MGKLTEKDYTLLEEEAAQVEYGSVNLEFKNGVCVAIAHSGRKLTEAGIAFREKRGSNPGKKVYRQD